MWHFFLFIFQRTQINTKVPWQNNAAVEKYFIPLIRNKQAISPGINFSYGFLVFSFVIFLHHVSVKFISVSEKTESHPGTKLQVGAFGVQTVTAEGGG